MINVAELLKDCPKGMELNCPMFENLEFDHIDKNNGAYPIICRVKTEWGSYNTHSFTEYGCYQTEKYSKCVIFPKGKTTWDGFQRLFKDGDVVTYKLRGSLVAFIYKQRTSTPLVESHFALYAQNMGFSIDGNIALKEEEIVFSTEEEKQKLFDAIKANGYKWNPETKTLEKLIVPKFKVGDRIKNKYTCEIVTVKRISEFDYIALLNDIETSIDRKFEEHWELVPNKFDISILKPFESKVLVRDYDNQIWIPTFWGKYLGDDSNCSYLTTNGCYKYCIPYEGNEHLLGTTNNCNV